jgi:hypothetical protein
MSVPGSQCLSLFICLLMSVPLQSVAESFDEISNDLTLIYRSARKVISDNQQHINNPELGDKGLSGEVVATKTLENYQAVSGQALDPAKLTEAQAAMLEAVREVMTGNQALINEKGTGFKGFLPAIFARQVANKFTEKMAGKMEIKLTAPKDYVRNRANRPDKWENEVIETKFKLPDYQVGKAFSATTTVNGKPAFRYILPEYYGPSCLNCHGQPKGAVDITGGKMEGGILDELGGAISLVIYQE